MTTPDSDRLDAYFEYLTALSPPAMKAWLSIDEADFCAAVEDAIHDVMVEIEAGAKLYKGLKEPALSLMLAQLLRQAMLPAVAEGYHNGHTDVMVSHPRKLPMAMLGECKIYRGYKQHHDGCKQVLDRYSSGRASRAFCLEFFMVDGMYAKLANLRTEFDHQQPLGQIGVSADHRLKGAFLTLHKHFTAAQLELLHLGCNLFCLET